MSPVRTVRNPTRPPGQHRGKQQSSRLPGSSGSHGADLMGRKDWNGASMLNSSRGYHHKPDPQPPQEPETKPEKPRGRGIDDSHGLFARSVFPIPGGRG